MPFDFFSSFPWGFCSIKGTKRKGWAVLAISQVVLWRRKAFHSFKNTPQFGHVLERPPDSGGAQWAQSCSFFIVKFWETPGVGL